MITIEYQPDVAETTVATLDFLYQRPIIKILLILLQVYGVIMLAVFSIKASLGIFTSHDLPLLVFIVAWLLWYRKFNKFILYRILTRQKTVQTTKLFQISAYKLWWQTGSNKQAMQQEWRHIKYVYQNSSGYLVPLIGMANAGKFIWLPQRGFFAAQAETEFLALLAQHKVVIKPI